MLYFHYVRNIHLRPARTKNEDVQIVRLHCHISYYRLIRDATLGASPISIHWRRASLERVSHFDNHLRRASKVHVTDLITGWAPIALIRDMSRVTRKESETLFILARRRFNCRLSPL
jgi:hypothetical protein